MSTLEAKRARDLWPFPAKAAIFDFDGTLAHTDFLWDRVNGTFVERHGKTYDPDSFKDLYENTFEESTRALLSIFEIDLSVEAANSELNDIAAELYVSEVSPRAGALIFIKALRLAGIPLALASANDSRVLGPFFEHAGMDGLFDVEISSAEVPVSKAEPDIYLAAAGALGVEPQDCLVFEDLLLAISTAHDAGMSTCAIFGDHPEEEEAKRVLADYYINSWKDIPLP